MSTSHKIIIAIDGHSSCGKSTMAKSLAKELDYIFVDTGAMYRAVTLYLQDQKVDLSNQEDVKAALQEISISFKKIDGHNHTILNGLDIEKEIRTSRVANLVSEVAAMNDVRLLLKTQQQNLGKDKGVVMDGRDIGTVIFPEAELKLFMTANIEVRSQRRFDELKDRGIETSLEIVKQNLEKRDRIDSSREFAPLVKAEDAVEIDTSYMSKTEQLDLALQFVHSRLKNLVVI